MKQIKKSFHPCLLLLFSCAAMLTVPSRALTSDGLALLSLKSAATDRNSVGAFADWNASDTDPCRWSGVSCASVPGQSQPRVVALAIAGRNLSGYIPSELGALAFLRRLNLHGNRISGQIPAGILSATSLHSLFLYDNNLTGPIPAGICDRLIHLQNLDLSRNRLSGGVPEDISDCRQLQRLILAGNSISGKIPAGIGSLKNLVQLDLSSNSLRGTLPMDIGELSSLTGTLNLSYNRFSGEIPATLGDLPVTVDLDLRSNDFSGSVPLDGSLSNQGPTAFLDNPKLCGFPLQTPCRNSTPPLDSIHIPTPNYGEIGKQHLSSEAVIAISIGDAACVAVVGMIVVLVYWRKKDRQGTTCSCKGRERLGKGRSAWCCLSCGNSAELPLDQEGGNGILVALDKAFQVELDELLRASAYVLGKGGNGIVYKVVVGNGVPVVVRRVGEGSGSGILQRYREFAAEIQAISRVRHRNLVRLRAYYWASDEKLLISDFIPNGNLANALHGGKSGQYSSSKHLSWPTRLQIAKGIASGLAYIHDYSIKKYAHGDIKPTNILLDGNFNPYISDFGLPRLAALTGSSDHHDNPNSATGLMSAYIGTTMGSSSSKRLTSAIDHSRGSRAFSYCYKAPEARVAAAGGNKQPTQKWDVYSFGVVLLEMVTGRSATMQLATMDMELGEWARKALTLEDVALVDLVDPSFSVIMREVNVKKEMLAVLNLGIECTERDPDARPRMKTLLDSLEKLIGVNKSSSHK